MDRPQTIDRTPLGLLVLGFGGHARAVADVAMATGIGQLRFVDRNAQAGENFLGFPVTSQTPEDLEVGWQAFVASGDSTQRAAQIESLDKLGFELASLKAPSASLGVGSRIAPGCFIGQQSHIGPMAEIGKGCIVNSGAIVEHECVIDQFTHISVNATVAGRCRIGRSVMVGAGATIIDGLELADHVVVGAGAVVTQSISEAGVYVGVPAKKIG